MTNAMKEFIDAATIVMDQIIEIPVSITHNGRRWEIVESSPKTIAEIRDDIITQVVNSSEYIYADPVMFSWDFFIRHVNHLSGGRPTTLKELVEDFQ